MMLFIYSIVAILLFSEGKLLGSAHVGQSWAEMDDEMDFSNPLVFPGEKKVTLPRIKPFKSQDPEQEQERFTDGYVLLPPPGATSLKRVPVKSSPPKISVQPEHVIHNMGEDLSQILKNLLRPNVDNILVLEVPGPIFTISPLINYAYAFAQLDIEKAPELTAYLENPSQRAGFEKFLCQTIVANQFPSFFVSDPSFLKELEEGLWQKSLKVLLIVDCPFSQREEFLKVLLAHKINLGFREAMGADPAELKDAGFQNKVFFRNGQENPFLSSMGYLLNMAKSSATNIIHVHTFLKKQDLEILEKVFPGYKSVCYNKQGNVLSKGFQEEKILEHN